MEPGAEFKRLMGWDHSTPPGQVWALADLVSTPTEHITRELVDARHLGACGMIGQAAEMTSGESPR